MKKDKKYNKALVRAYIQLLSRILILMIAGLIIFSQVLLIAPNKGMDMFPSIKDGDLMLANRLDSNYENGDVVIYTQQNSRLVGRIAAIEKDIVEIDENGNVRVNGTLQSGEIVFPTYPKEGLTYPYEVPEGHVFILGDYRTETKDSRDFGTVPEKAIDGKVISLMRRRGL